MADKVTAGQVFHQVHWFSAVSIIPIMIQTHLRLNVTLNIRTSGWSLRTFKESNDFCDIVKNWTGKYFRIIVCGFKVLKLLLEFNFMSLLRICDVKVPYECFCGVEMFDSKSVAAMSRLNAVALFRRSFPTDFTEETLIEFSKFGALLFSSNLCESIWIHEILKELLVW
jgi:hypothetical protein